MQMSRGAGEQAVPACRNWAGLKEGDPVMLRASQ